MRTSRRRLLAATAALTAAACTTRRPILTGSERATLEAMCDRIIPADQDPGALWAGVPGFIEKQLARGYKRYFDAYQRGLAGVNDSSREIFGREFAALAAPQQDQVLAALENKRAPGRTWWEQNAREFFDLVVAHTMQGFYSSPRHGGNRDAVSWRMLGLAVSPVRGRNPYVFSGKES